MLDAPGSIREKAVRPRHRVPAILTLARRRFPLAARKRKRSLLLITPPGERADRTLTARAEHRRTPGEASAQEDRQRDPVRGALRLSIAVPAHRPAAMADRVLVLPAVEEAGVTEMLLTELRRSARRQAGRADEPSTGIIDSQSVKGADTVSRDSRGYDANKKINGRKRFIVTDISGLLVTVAVMAASRQDRDGAKTTLLSTYLTTRPGMSSPTRVMPDGWWTGLTTCCAPPWRSGASALPSVGSTSSHAGGWSSGRWPG